MSGTSSSRLFLRQGGILQNLGAYQRLAGITNSLFKKLFDASGIQYVSSEPVFASEEKQPGGGTNLRKENCRERTLRRKSSFASMELAKMFAVVAFLASACGAMVYRTDSPCDFTDVAIDDQILSRLISRLPESIESGSARLPHTAPWTGSRWAHC
ncbi:hypothetical protein MTO96_026329 [Rhipicephalus appendiculatus]